MTDIVSKVDKLTQFVEKMLFLPYLFAHMRKKNYLCSRFAKRI